MTAITKEYTTYTATKFYKSGNLSWGHSWPCMLYGNTVDETYRSRGSHCVWQAENLAAVLDAMGIDNYVMELGVSTNGVIDGSQWHHTVYVPQYDLVIGNGVVETLVYNHPSSLVSYVDQNTPRSIIRFISHGGEWVALVISGNPKEIYYWGTISPNQLPDVLIHLTNIHGNILQGLVINGDKSWAISMDEFVSDLGALQSSYSPAKLP